MAVDRSALEVKPEIPKRKSSRSRKILLGIFITSVILNLLTAGFVFYIFVNMNKLSSRVGLFQHKMEMQRITSQREIDNLKSHYSFTQFTLRQHQQLITNQQNTIIQLFEQLSSLKNQVIQMSDLTQKQKQKYEQQNDNLLQKLSDRLSQAYKNIKTSQFLVQAQQKVNTATQNMRRSLNSNFNKKNINRVQQKTKKILDEVGQNISTKINNLNLQERKQKLTASTKEIWEKGKQKWNKLGRIFNDELPQGDLL